MRRHWDKWWDTLSEEQRQHVIRAVNEDQLPVPPETVNLLISTSAPTGPVQTQWNNDPSTATWVTLGRVVDYVKSRPAE